jgi:hypothetical protein
MDGQVGVCHSLQDTCVSAAMLVWLTAVAGATHADFQGTMSSRKEKEKEKDKATPTAFALTAKLDDCHRQFLQLLTVSCAAAHSRAAKALRRGASNDLR